MSWITTNGEDESITHDSDNLRAILTTGLTLYTKHTEWFLKHRETTLRQLALLITAELAIQKFVVDPDGTSSPARVLLLLLACLSPLLAHSGIRSCKQAFQAAMENIILVNKILWSMGPSGKVFTDHNVDESFIPAHQDTTLQVPRFLEHSVKAASTNCFVNDNLSFRKGLSRLFLLDWFLRRKKIKEIKPPNTFFWTTILIWILGMIGIAIGTICFFSGS